MNEKILIVDDEESIADLVEVYLQNEGYRVCKFYNAADALSCLKKEELSLAILDVMLPDMGSREFLANFNEFIWYPAEVDVSIRLGWFYHPLQIFTLKSLNHLMKIYYNSAGNNALMLLNIPPNKNGLLAKSDVRRLRQMGKWLKKEDELLISDVKTEKSEDGFEINLKFPKQSVDRVRLSEDTTKSQRVERFSIYADGKKLFGGTIIGFSKIAVFEPTVTDNLTIKIEECRKEPYINKAEVIATGAYRVK